MLCSVFTAVCARLLALAIPSLNISALIIGGIMPLLPGLSMTNAIRDTILGRMSELRVACDEAETLTAKKYWPYPTYGDLLFGVK